MPSESDPPDGSVGTSGSKGMDATVPAGMPLIDVGDGAPAGPEPIRQSDRYRLGVELGRGGMGRVVEAFDVQLGRTVALKEALPRGGHGTHRRFAREIQITARLEHASIVPLYDSGTTPDGRPYYVMRRVSGRPFDEMITRARGLGERLTLLPALKAAIDAIGHAHRRGVIHRDLKPANILVGDLGETVVIDWGLAKVIGEDDISMEPSRDPEPTASDSLHTQAGSVFGTPGFMAPEQARGEELGPRGDVYALGATLYQLLSGTPPYSGHSATEVIDRNRKAQIKPIAEAAPEAPRELIAIVNKSLAPDPGDRYPNAGALAEDVRRFLDGQLVAAHRYTRRQRLRRFVLRHRAPLVVAALAAVAVAALSWFSVHRVLRERAIAIDRERVAEDRAEALIVTRARALIDTNPTQALAALKSLPAGSAHEPEARGVAQAASARGVAWGIDDDPGSTSPQYPSLSANGARLAIANIDGHLRVFDTATHALLRDATYQRGLHTFWVQDAARLFVYDNTSAPTLLDPVSGARTALAVGALEYAATSDRGDRVAYIEHGNKVAGLLELATGKITPLVTAKRVGALVVAPDGSWIALAADHDAIVFDSAGREIARKVGAGAMVHATASRDRQLAVLADNAIWQLDLEHATWTEIPPALNANTFVLHLQYRGDVLTMLTTRGEIREYRRGEWVQRLQLEQIGSQLSAVGTDLVVVSSGDGRLYWVSPTTSGVIALPSIFRTLHVAGSSHSGRLAVAGDDLVMVYDLSSLSPARIGAIETPTFMFLDDDTLLFWSNAEPWTLFRTQTGQRITFDLPWMGAPMPLDVLPEEGRALFGYLERQSHLIEVRDDALPFHHLATMPNVSNGADMPYVGRLLLGDGTVFSTDSDLQGTTSNARPHEVAHLDGTVVSIARLGYLEFGAISQHGEIVRGSLATGALERARVPANAAYVAGGYEGKLVIGSGSQLLLWDHADVREIAHFTQPISGLLQIAGGIGVVLGDQRVLDVVQDPATQAFAATEILPRGSVNINVANGGKVMISRGNGSLLNVVELPSRVRWTLPIVNEVAGTIAVGPTSNQVVQQYDGLVTWKLPHIDGDLHAWLEHQTNAIEDADGELAWPWQTAAAAAAAAAATPP